MTDTANELDRIDNEASAWLVRLRSDRVSIEDKEAFSRWITQHPLHQQHFDEIAELWGDLSVCRAMDFGVDLDPTVAASPSTTDTGWFGGLRLSYVGAFATLVLALFIGLVTTGNQEAPAPILYNTAVGEQERVLLSDGSTLILNTNSRVSVNISDSERSLTLLHGEAYFAVAKDAQRPFVVNLGATTATAVGTAFAIYREGESATIAVEEGIVRVASQQNPDRHHALLYADQQLLTERARLGQVESVAMASVLDWTQQRLVYEDVPLASVVQEINRYTDRKVRLSGGHLAAMSVSGVFSLEQPDEIVTALTAALDIDAKAVSDTLVLLYKDES